MDLAFSFELLANNEGLWGLALFDGFKYSVTVDKRFIHYLSDFLEPNFGEVGYPCRFWCDLGLWRGIEDGKNTDALLLAYLLVAPGGSIFLEY